MIFRKTMTQDLLYMTEHCANRKIERTQLDTIDYISTLEHEGIPLIVGGFRMITTTTAWCWIDLSDEAGKYIIQVYRVIREWINQFVKSHGIKRLQSFIRTNYPEAIRLVEHLGFEKESTMKHFFGDEDAYMYVRLI